MGGAAAQVEQEHLPEGGTPQVSQPLRSSAHNPAPDSVSRPPGVVAAHTTFHEHGKYPPDILNILDNNWYSKDLQDRANTLERVVLLEVVVSEGKTVGGFAFGKVGEFPERTSNKTSGKWGGKELFLPTLVCDIPGG